MICSIAKSWAYLDGTIRRVLSSQASMLDGSCISVACERFPAPRLAHVIIRVEGGKTYARNECRTAGNRQHAQDSCRAWPYQPKILRMREIHPEKFCNQGWTGGGFGVEDEQG